MYVISRTLGCPIDLERVQKVNLISYSSAAPSAAKG